MVWAGIALYLLFITPVQAGLLAEWGAEESGLHVGIMVWGVRKIYHLPLKRNAEGKLYLEMPRPLKRRKKKHKSKKDLITLIIRLLYLRKKMHVSIRLRLLSAQAFIRLPDAGQTALLCGLLSALFSALFPHGSSRFLPAYHGRNLGRAACIAEGRLGTICMAGILWKLHEKRHAKKEETKWSIPSQN